MVHNKGKRIASSIKIYVLLPVGLICTQNPGHIELRSRLTHGCFPVFNRGHPFCFSLDPLVIVVVYVFLYCSLELIE